VGIPSVVPCKLQLMLIRVASLFAVPRHHETTH
jgi:hypothetical protein